MCVCLLLQYLLQSCTRVEGFRVSPVGLKKKKRQKFAVHAGGCARNGGEKRNVLIVSVLLPRAIDLALRSNMERRVDVLRVPGEI